MFVNKLIKIINASSEHRSSEDLDKIRQLLRKSTKDINDVTLVTACHAAVKAGNFPILEILVLEGQADLTIRDEQGKKPKDYAKDKDFSLKMAALNAEQRRRKQSSGMHLHDIIRTASKRAIKARIASHPQEINETTYCQRNAGHIAAMYYPKCIKWLVAAGLDLSAEDNMGDTCLEVALLDKASKKALLQRYRTLFIDPMSEDEQVSSLSLLLQDLRVTAPKRHRSHSVAAQRNAVTRVQSFRLLPREVAETLPENDTIDDIIQADSIPRLRAHIQNNSLSHKVFVARACDAQKSRIVVWLLQHQIPLDTLSPLLATISKEQAAFWFKVIERIDAVNRNRASDDQTQLQIFKQHEVHFQRLLLQNGLLQSLLPNDVFDIELLDIVAISQKSGCKEDLLEALYQIISNPFDAIVLRQTTLGLLSLHSTEDIFKAIIALAPSVSAAQKRHILFLIKELFCQDNVRKSYMSKRFCMTMLKELFDALELSQREQFYDALLNILNAIRKLHNPLIEISLLVQARLAESGFRYREESQAVQQSSTLPKNYEPHDLAMACRAISISFYKRVHSTEFGHKQWQGEKKRDTSPTIVQSQQLFDALSQYVQTEIFKRKKLHHRVEFISRIVSTIEILLEDEMPDLNSAMALISALNSRPVSRLTETFAALDEKTTKRLALINKKLDGVDNYRSHREMMRTNPKCLPFLGVYLRDMEFSHNNNFADSTALMGRAYQELSNRKSSLMHVRPAPALGLLPILQSWQYLSDIEIYQLSHGIQGGLIYLENDMPLEHVIKYLQVYCETGLAVRIFYENQTSEGQEVIAVLFSLLRVLVIRQPQITENEIRQCIELLGQLKQNDPLQQVFNEEKLAFNIWYTRFYEMALLPQFSRQRSVTLPEALKLEAEVQKPNMRHSCH